jgi:hypothetical protein
VIHAPEHLALLLVELHIPLEDRLPFRRQNIVKLLHVKIRTNADHLQRGLFGLQRRTHAETQQTQAGDSKRLHD